MKTRPASAGAGGSIATSFSRISFSRTIIFSFRSKCAALSFSAFPKRRHLIIRQIHLIEQFIKPSDIGGEIILEKLRIRAASPANAGRSTC